MNPTYFRAVGDYNNDGNLDLAVSNIQNQIGFLLTGPSGGVSQEVHLSQSKPVTHLLAADLNGDCVDDLIFVPITSLLLPTPEPLGVLLADPCSLTD